MGAEYRPTPKANSGNPSTKNGKTNNESGLALDPPTGGIITRASSGAPATRAVKPAAGAPTIPTKPLTYGDLKQYHLARIRIAADGRERSHAVLKNHRSVINSWTAFRLVRGGGSYIQGAGDALPLGDEIGADFPAELAAYLDDQEGRGKKKGTLNDRKSIMWSVHESAVELLRAQLLPADFVGALRSLIEHSGMTEARITAQVGLGEGRLRDWLRRGEIPSHVSLPAIQRLEDLFKLRRGTLSDRLPHLEVRRGTWRLVRGTTPWREHMREQQKFTYALSELPATVAAECHDLVLFKTDDVWLDQHGFRRAQEWRIRRNRDRSPSADKFVNDLRKFMGWLRLPADAGHPWSRGKGLSTESFDLALLSDADLVLPFLDFWRERSYSKSFNSGTVCFAVQCMSLIKEETGFLRQQPSYGARLPTPIPADKWEEWCESNYHRFARFLRTVKKSKNRPMRKTRDPFAAVRSFIEDRQHPLSALWEMTANMKRLTPLKLKMSPILLALHKRDIAFGEFITSYPLRCENFSLMTWIPKSGADLTGRGKRYVETDEASNLYQKPDGSWWIRFTSEEMKNGKAVDVPVAKSVVPSLVEYLFEHRLVLNQRLKEAIRRRRNLKDLPPLTPEEERAIDCCRYVFRPAPTYLGLMSDKKFTACKGVEQMSNSSISGMMFRMSQRFIAGCKGFCAHAVRAIVASEYIKNYPNGFAVAAAALNITETVVRRHYAWVRACDQIKPWQDYHESLRERFESGVCVN